MPNNFTTDLDIPDPDTTDEPYAHVGAGSLVVSIKRESWGIVIDVWDDTDPYASPASFTVENPDKES